MNVTHGFVKKCLFLIALAVAGALLFRGFVIQSYRSADISMEDTLGAGDYFLVNKFIFGRSVPFTDKRLFTFREPRRGDIVVFAYPEDPRKDFVMRVVGLAGDVVEGRDKVVYVNGLSEDGPPTVHREPETVPREQNPRDNFGPVNIPANELFVMGDNRDHSYDSRFWGCVGSNRVKGAAFFRYWSWDAEERRVRWDRIGRIR